MGTQRLWSSATFALISLLGAMLAAASTCAQGACRECQHEKCGDLLEICGMDSDCACMGDCVGGAGLGGVDDCLGTCALTDRPPGFVPLEECMALGCPDGDECSARGDSAGADTSDSGGSGTTAIAGGGDLADCSIDPDLSFDPDGAVLQLESADKTVCVRLERRDDGAGSMANTNWTLLEIRVGPLGEVAHVDDPAQFCWFSSHHNFTDWAHVWTGSTHHDLKLREEGHGGARTYELHTFEQGPVDPGVCAPLADGTVALGSPVELFPVRP